MTGYILGDVLVGDLCHRVLNTAWTEVACCTPGARTAIYMNSVKIGAPWQVSGPVKQGE